MHYPAQGKTGGKIFPLFASKNVHYLRFTYIYAAVYDPISNFNRGVSRRRVQLIIKKYPRESQITRMLIWSNKVNFIKLIKALPLRDRDSKQKTEANTKTNT